MITHLLDPLAISDPYEVYRGLREHAPITWLPEHHAWFVATHADVDAAFRDTRLSSDRLSPLEARLSPTNQALLGNTFDLLRGWMVFHDPPGHERLRGPVRRAFTPKAVERLRDPVIEIVDEHLDELEARLLDGDTVDLIEEFAFPVPAIVIAELLGVPSEDRDEFKTWSDQLAGIVFGASNRPDQAATAAAGSARFAAYFTDLIERYRRDPGDNLVSALIEAAAVADPPLEATELVGACTLLLFGGHETTTNLIGNSVHTLLTHPGAHATFLEDRDGRSRALEELHRFDGSSKVMVRSSAVDHERGGVEISAGDTVFLGIGAANRDPAVFERPDDLVLARPNAHRHLGYGYGLHFCLGAPLARLETDVAIGRLVDRLPGLRLAVDESALSWGATILGRGLTTLPVTVSPR
ncbi:MAG: cytochrome P450 [Ilumatobacter sp.]|uniref:cytochrome P450 n=1 Tax=Ilumatobacter sp. TaxID=1967498 RepID=UPI003918C17A